MSNHPTRDIAVLIPSFQPDGQLTPYVEQLVQADFAQIVIVDDGSGAAYDAVFDTLDALDGVTVLRYEPNCGKGYALRLGMRYIEDNDQDCAFVITADSDGQHTVADILAMADTLRQDSAGLLLGTRDFTAADVPRRSRAGNQITSKVFQVLYGQKVTDTQTGLRGFSRAMIHRLLEVKGDRYDYEMNQLILCAIDGISIRSLPIQTVYENNNEGSHFRTVVDSWRIYRAIFSRFARFVASSAVCFLVDYGVYLLINYLLKTYVPVLDQSMRIFVLRFMARIAIATVAARAVSATINFIINQKMVFQSQVRTGKAFLRYACTVVLIVALSAGIVSTLHIGLGLSETITKIPVDIVLFCLSYFLQRKWVFGGGAKPHGQHKEKNHG
ncbi:MAG TPA: bifunctional glycosyltransferase family 2/GtrA family protein [Candidatus Limiplasma sp.]|nr:bifunctional glycosyltransferase family 2/GtrA family protein [Candidatus Limiplasma sp.]